jgi:hypothetical protein
VSEIEANEDLKQMFKVAVDKPKYSDSDSTKNIENVTLIVLEDKICVPLALQERIVA